jgi:hypothetical protein
MSGRKTALLIKTDKRILRVYVDSNGRAGVVMHEYSKRCNYSATVILHFTAEELFRFALLKVKEATT